jgi:hypothetical protein
VRHDRTVARRPQEVHQAQAVRSPGNAGDHGLLLTKPTLQAKNGLDIFEHDMRKPDRSLYLH